ncbi:MAG TPA: AMP-binding protein [Chitinophaga sp.]|nr:AMP-binding protein [Chitinophaga sp.]
MKIPYLEKQPAEVIHRYQSRKLRELLRYLQTNSPYYRRVFAARNVDIDLIHTVDDLVYLPATTKEDLQQHNADFQCVPRKEIIDFVNTSGTLGRPVTFGLTDNDLDRLAYNEFLSFTTAGATAGDVFQLMVTMDKRFMAGMAYFLGARKMGAGIIRAGNGLPGMQWNTIMELRPDILIAVPSFLLKMLEYAVAHGIDPNTTSVSKVICVGENIRNADFSLNALGERIVSKWDVTLHSTYAATEMGAAFTECAAGQGGHHQPELLIVEILDDQNQPVPEGQPGELTITTLGITGMPLLRFKTGDICTRHTTPCTCGRHTQRLGPILGRKKQMIKLKGTTLYPSAIFDVLNRMEFVKEYVVEVFNNELDTDEVVLHIHCGDSRNEMVAAIKQHLQATLRVTPQIKFASAEEVRALQASVSLRKLTQFIDRRTQTPILV